MGYPNHHIMKRNRLIRLKETKGLCEICERPARLVHHIDESMDNHAITNLSPLCDLCHHAIHHADSLNGKGATKIIRLYGMSFADMARKYGETKSFYQTLHTNNKLNDFLKEPDTYAYFRPHIQYKKVYGLTLSGLVKNYGESVSFYRKKHRNGELYDWLVEKKGTIFAVSES